MLSEVAGRGSGVCGSLDTRAGRGRMTSVKIVGQVMDSFLGGLIWDAGQVDVPTAADGGVFPPAAGRRHPAVPSKGPPPQV